MRFVCGSDHAGFRLKEELKKHLEEKGITVHDLGTHNTESVDYPDFGAKVARSVAAGEADLGLLVCGTGIGMAMTANKIAGIRAAAVSDTFSAHASREHNDANVLCLGERVVGTGLAKDILDVFVGASFAGGRHGPRVAKIDALDYELPADLQAPHVRADEREHGDRCDGKTERGGRTERDRRELRLTRLLDHRLEGAEGMKALRRGRTRGGERHNHRQETNPCQRSQFQPTTWHKHPRLSTNRAGPITGLRPCSIRGSLQDVRHLRRALRSTARKGRLR